MWRVHLCFLCIILLGTAVLGRALYIQQIEGEKWISLAGKQHLKYVDVSAERGSIYSEDGNLLSTSIPVFDVYVDLMADGLREKQGKRFHDNLDSLCYNLSNLFQDKSASEYRKILTSAYKKKKRYFALKKKISFEEYTALRDFPLVRQGRNKSGFIMEVRDNRVNPYVLLANRTIGLSRGDTSKNVGLERSYDSVLRGQAGHRLMRYVAGSYIPVSGAEIDPENGKDIITTIDTYIQDIAENALLRMMDSNNSLHGTCIVMEVNTGKIKAIANLGRRPDGEYLEDYNYAVGHSSEPGSVFKLATLMSLLEDKYVDTGSIVDCEGGMINFYGLRIKDSHLGTREITVKEAFARSSNVAFAKLADEYYHNQPEKWYQHLKRIRLNERIGIDIVGAAKPYIKSPDSKYWTKTTIPFMAHGYEELVTPLHMLMFYNAVANNGKMMKPYLVNSINNYGVELQKFEPEVLVEQIASPETVGKLKDCLREVVEGAHGTARSLKNNIYSFGGKTGTAVTAMDNRGYNKGAKIYQSAFIGFFPFENPRYSIAVVVQNGRESRLNYGGVVSGPIFKEVADKVYAYKISNEKVTDFVTVPDSSYYRMVGLNSDVQKILNAFSFKIHGKEDAKYTAPVLKNGNATMIAASINENNTVPDVTGMGLKDAVYLLENKGLEVQVSGRGKVVSQSIERNTLITRGQKIKIELN